MAPVLHKNGPFGNDEMARGNKGVEEVGRDISDLNVKYDGVQQ